jgi:N utilization substance protein A
MNELDLRQLIAQVAKAKGISQEKLHEALEIAMLKAAKKVFGNHKAIEATFDEDRGEVTLSHVILIIGDDFDEEDDFDDEEDREAESEIDRLTRTREENQLHVDVARSEYALNLNVGEQIRLPILYQESLLSQQLTLAKAERRGKKKNDPDRDTLEYRIQYLTQRLHEERKLVKKYTERFGDLLLLDARASGFGRIAAQAAKVVIQDKVRQAERDKIYEDFSGREEIESGEIRRFERGGDIIVALSTPDQEQQIEALLPRSEQIPHETYRLGKTVRCVIKEVSKESKNAQIILSQRHENFIKKLFEQNVPEIYHGIVEIKDVSRIYGEVRGVKVSVYSKDPNVDPAGSCIGPNGSRVKIVEEAIGRDKIEVIQYSSEPHIYVCNAIRPAEVSRLLIDHENRKMDVIVPDDQLSKVIGRRGKNVRLASLLTGWGLDIYAESKMIERENRVRELLALQEGVNPEALDVIWRLKNVRSLEQLAESELGTFSDLPGVSEEDEEILIHVAQELLDRRDQGEDLFNEDSIEDTWHTWPRHHSLLTREIFNRCANIGLSSLDRLAKVQPEDLAERIGVGYQNAIEILSAVRQSLK